MDRIGQGNYVVVVISDKYLKSENRMYEIVQIAKNGQFHDRIFPIVLSDANFYKPVNRVKYISHWEQQKMELNESMKSLNDMSMIAEIQKELANYNDIHQSISNILFVLKDMNTLTPDMHQDSHFEAMFKAIDDKIALDNELNKNFKAADEELKNRILDNQNKEYAYDIFLSFSNKNKSEVEKTAAILRQYGLRVFVSNDSLAESIGDSFGDRINYALEHSQHFALLCTPEAMASKWVKGEHEAFFNHCYDPNTNRRFFILKGSNFTDKPLPLTYRTLQYAEQATDIVKVLGIEVLKEKQKEIPKAEKELADLETRKENYKELFEIFFTDGVINSREKAQLEKRQKELDLTDEQVAEIEQAIELVHEEETLWQNAKSNDLIKSYQNYLSSYPSGKYVAEAKNKISQLEQITKQKEALKIAAEKSVIFDYELVYVAGGSYQMGRNESRDGEGSYNEKPLHTVKVDSFYIGKYPVTQAQWKAIMGENPSHFKNCDNCPVENVNWHDIQAFIRKLKEKTGKTYRPPTEEEWEYAARGGNQSNGYKYAGNNSIANVAWYDGNSNIKTHSVGGKSPNELGIYDMTGNMWEWTASGWSDNYEKNRSSERYVLRGGSWDNYAYDCRVAYRYDAYPSSRNYKYGFRLVSSQ